MSGSGSTSRERILSRIREALEGRSIVEHPGAFEGWRPVAVADGDDVSAGAAASAADPVEGFIALFRAAGGEAVRVPDRVAAAAWLDGFARDFRTAAFGRGVPESLRPALPETRPRDADLGVSMARGAVAETGSLIMDARDGRRAQLLVPAHVVIVAAATVHASLVDALASMRADLPSAIGLHSGPSKSADIGQIMVKGVHGPGRVVAVIVTARVHE